MKIVDTIKLVGANLEVSTKVMKQVLPLLPKIKMKTKNNDIILGKWHKRK